MVASGLLDPITYHNYDGIYAEDCSLMVPYQWSYNAGSFLLGAAAMYNHTTRADRDVWRERVDGLLNGSSVFFGGDAGNVMTEAACEPVGLCNVDQQSFKAYLARWMAATTKWAPWTYDHVMPLLRPSAAAAAATCTGGDSGSLCGLRWTEREFDGWTGVGQQMAAMEVVLACLIQDMRAPVAEGEGGTSAGDPAAGGEDVGRSTGHEFRPVSAADKAGTWALTVLALEMSRLMTSTYVIRIITKVCESLFLKTNQPGEDVRFFFDDINL
ncbi:hypothetical protein VTJ49DRAFT_6845 [Mycothermus thermophilus]|uniref:mannan endo-1,6-alpha-mannosidase n=1 Tax=Humicola insolens TaxID=85995 RepID=A0ABR3VQH6_HUMIN